MSERSWSFVVPLVEMPPSPNKKLHYLKRAQLIRDTRRQVALVAQSERNRLKAPAAAEFRKLSLDLERPGRMGAHPLDLDNLIGALIPVVNGLKAPNERQPVGSSWILDDDENAVAITYHQHPGRRLAVHIGVTISTEAHHGD